MAGIEPSDIRKWTSIIEAVDGINLAQGNSHVEPAADFDELVLEVERAIRKGAATTGFNTYSPASGVTALREAIAVKCREFNGIEVDPHPTEGTVTVTDGATGGLVCALHAIADPGDEVILFSPFYGYHYKALQMLGLRACIAPLRGPGWEFDEEEISSLIGGKTRAIIVNTPNNPTGKVFRRDEFERLVRLCHRHDIYLISDEVYEFITYDGAEHLSPGALPEAGSRVITVSSFSKTLAITGWRLGYVVASPELTYRVRIANEMLYVCAPTPLQHAIAPFVANWAEFRGLAAKFQRKRDLLVSALHSAGIGFQVPKGAYYILGDFADQGFGSDVEINQYLVDKFRVAGVPGSAFYEGVPFTGQVRFCYAVFDSELERLASSLAQS